MSLRMSPERVLSLRGAPAYVGGRESKLAFAGCQCTVGHGGMA